MEKEKEAVEENKEEGAPKPKQFYKHETITDGDYMSVEVLTPVKIGASGKSSIDKDGKKIFVGKTFISVNDKPQPYTFNIIEASDLKQAVDCFEQSLQNALEETRKSVEEFQKQQMEAQKNKIVTPGSPGGIIQT